MTTLRTAGRVNRPLLVALVGVALLTTVWACSECGGLTRLFGPPRVTAIESYAEGPEEIVFDHSDFDALLKLHVDDAGLVDYAVLKQAPAELDAYLAALAQAPFDQLGRNEKLALLLNAYNAFTLRLILDHFPLDSIKDIPDDQRWKAKRFLLAGRVYSLNALEHEQIRPNFKEPRVHFALVCAALGCPPLRAEAFVGARLEEQLQNQSQHVHSDERWFRFDPEQRSLKLTSLYDWYADDFRQAAGSVAAFAARYSNGLKQALDSGDDVSVDYLPYDWKLNLRDQQN